MIKDMLCFEDKGRVEHEKEKSYYNNIFNDSYWNLYAFCHREYFL